MRSSALALLALGLASRAFELPQIPFLSSTKLNASAPEPATVRIAILGAGAGGSSAAYWISLAKARFELDVEVDVYEKEDYIGGRSTVVYPYDDTSYAAVELGASIFTPQHKNMMRAAEEFNLTRTPDKDGETELGVWDGEKILVTLGGPTVWNTWNMIKLIWRYGFETPQKVGYSVSLTVQQFLRLYTVSSPTWTNLESLATTMEWSELVSNTVADYIIKIKGQSAKYVYELVETATRFNYGQNADDIHALEGMSALAASGATAVQGGNKQVFEQLIKRSGANVLLSTPVTHVSRTKSETTPWTVKTDKLSKDYAAVIVAAPFHQTNTVFPASVSKVVPAQPYVHLHVTLVTTTSQFPNAVYFGQKAGSELPEMILTTYNGVRAGGKEPEFNSMSYHGKISETEWIVKILSKKAITDEWLRGMFMGQVGWVYRKEWDAYPVLPPTETFPPIVLDKGLYYVNAFEPFISTMETETISSRNIVELLLNEQFGTGICPPPSGESFTDGARDDKMFVLGWDC